MLFLNCWFLSGPEVCLPNPYALPLILYGTTLLTRYQVLSILLAESSLILIVVSYGEYCYYSSLQVVKPKH